MDGLLADFDGRWKGAAARILRTQTAKTALSGERRLGNSIERELAPGNLLRCSCLNALHNDT